MTRKGRAVRLKLSRKVDALIVVVAGVFDRWNSDAAQPEILLFQRAQDDVGGGKWEFPGGKVEMGESDSQALVRELQEEISITVKVQEKLGESPFSSPSGRDFVLRVYFVTGPVGEISLLEHQACKWVNPSTLVLSEISDGDIPLLEICFQKIRNRHGKN